MSDFVYCPRCERYKPRENSSPKGVCWACLKPSERIAFALDSGRIRFYEGGTYHDTQLAQKANEAILEHGGVVQAAEALGVNHGIVSKARKGVPTPAALETFDMPPKTVEVSPDMVLKKPRRPDKETRYRLHVECGYGEQGRRRKQQVEAALRARGYDSLTEFVEAALLERG